MGFQRLSALHGHSSTRAWTRGGPEYFLRFSGAVVELSPFLLLWFRVCTEPGVVSTSRHRSLHLQTSSSPPHFAHRVPVERFLDLATSCPPPPLPAPVLSFPCRTPAAGAEEGECSRHNTTRRRLRRGHGGQGRPHHRRRGVHRTQQELHQGSAGAPQTPHS